MKSGSGDTAYPSAPWRLGGRMWLGLFRAEAPAPPPEPLKPLLGPRRLVVLLARYERGTLRYDELLVGAPARLGLRCGLFAHCLWVDDAASLWGGRRIWGMPKQRARFDWDRGGVRVSDDAGLIAALAVDEGRAWLPPVPALAPFFGRRDDGWLFTVATLRARLGRAGLQMRECSPRFPCPMERAPRLALAGKPFLLTVPPPRRLPDTCQRGSSA